VNFNAKNAKGIRKGAQRKLSSATFAVKFNDSLGLKLVLTQSLQGREARFKDVGVALATPEGECVHPSLTRLRE
jgi:hypothetical protein